MFRKPLAHRRFVPAALVLLSLLGGLLGEGLHLLAESHRWCEVHAAMEHGEEDAQAESGTHEPHLPASTQTSGEAEHIALEAQDGADPEEHELCLLFIGIEEEPAATLCRHADLGPAIVRTQPISPERWTGFASVRLLRLAPKQSPPVA